MTQQKICTISIEKFDSTDEYSVNVHIFWEEPGGTAESIYRTQMFVDEVRFK